jgi:hypothetical protein
LAKDILKMKIGIITLSHGEKFKNDISYGKKTLELYCKKHDYYLLEDESMVGSHKFEIQWTKIALIQKFLKDKSFDYLVWIDADTIILNDAIRIETIIDRLMFEKYIMYSKDFGNWVNNGVIFIKNTEEAEQYFAETWNHPAEICREQGAMDKLYRYNWDNCRRYVQITDDPTEYNPVWFQYKYGQFLMHFPGCGEPCRKPNSLLQMMDMFCPIMLKGDNGHALDTPETFAKRLEWLELHAEKDLQEKKRQCEAQGWKYLPIDLE